MASRRMFSISIVDSDAFLDMPLSTQALYFHLSMRADDDGFLDNAKKIMRMIGSAQNEIEILLKKRFILSFDGGVVVIKHWKMHNYIRGDRCTPTKYQDELNQLKIKENNSYTDNVQEDVRQMSGRCQADVRQMVDAGKDRLGKVSIEREGENTESSQGDNLPPSKKTPQTKKFTPPTVDEVFEQMKSRGLDNRTEAVKFVARHESAGWMVGRSKMKSWPAAVITWMANKQEWSK